MPKNPMQVEQVVIKNVVAGGAAIATDDGYVGTLKVNPAADVVALTGNTTLTVTTHFNKNITNTGASGTIVLTLPAANAAKGRGFRVLSTVAQIIRLTPQTGESVYLAGSGVASKYQNIPATIGSSVDIWCDGTRYLVVNTNGIITKEA